MEFVRKGYEYTRNFVPLGLGYFPKTIGVRCGCSTSRLTALAIMLTNSGLGDYWEDVERYARNHLFETQLLDIDRMRALSAHAPAHDTKRPQATTRDVLERSLGAFTKFIDPTISSAAGCGGCCLANNSQALY